MQALVILEFILILDRNHLLLNAHRQLLLRQSQLFRPLPHPRQVIKRICHRSPPREKQLLLRLMAQLQLPLGDDLLWPQAT